MTATTAGELTNAHKLHRITFEIRGERFTVRPYQIRSEAGWVLLAANPPDWTGIRLRPNHPIEVENDPNLLGKES